MTTPELTTLITLITGTLVTIITLVAGFVLQYLREGRAQTATFERETRQHAWEQEDRDRAVEVLKFAALKTAKELAAHTTDTAHTLAAQTAATSTRLEGLIAENTDISTQAFHEANTVNLKLEKLGLEHNQLVAASVAVAASAASLEQGSAASAAASLKQIAVNTTPKE